MAELSADAADPPIDIRGYFTGIISVIETTDDKREIEYKDIKFEFDEGTNDKMKEITKRLSNGKIVMLGPEPTPEPVPVSTSSETTDSGTISKNIGGKSIKKKRGGKIRKTKKHGNKKYRNKK